MRVHRLGLFTLCAALWACGDNNTPNQEPELAGFELTTQEDLAVTRAVEAVDPEGDDVTIAVPEQPAHGTVTVTGNSITYTPDANYNGPDQFSVTASDGVNAVSAVVDVTVTALNDAPIGVADSLAASEDTASVVAATTLLANDSDVDGDPLSITAVGNAQNGTVSIAGTDVTFLPAANFVGGGSYEYTLSDGTVDVTVVVSVAIGDENDAPTAVDDTGTTDEDTAVAFAALAGNDTDPEAQTLAVTAVSDPTNGTVVLDAGTATFTPDADFNGTATFNYTVSDGVASDVGTVTITVAPVNDPPTAVDDNETTPEDTQIVLGTLAGNDADIDGPTLTVSAVANATNGTAVLDAGSVTFTPAANFVGTASFTYTVSDGTLTDDATVTIEVTAVNDPPVAVDDTAAVQEGTSVTITHAELLANDSDGGDGAALTLTTVQNASNGTATNNAADATVTFTPDAAFTGTATFEYVVSDGTLSDVGLVTVAVSADPVCGDGVIASPETCDDDNNANGDGCSDVCQEEAGFDCTGEPSTCTAICNDGIIVAGEVCDDGDADETNGCTTQCVAGVICNVTAFTDGDSFAVDPATGHCYVGFDATATTFDGAQASCLGIGGYLVTITSAAEDTLVTSVVNVGQSPWIGARDDANDVDDIFDWVTDEPFLFSRFATNQPDDDATFGGNGECLHIVDSTGWNDTNCNIDTFVVGQICEVEPDPCGDSLVQSFNGEECDDSNQIAGDGCNALCQTEVGCGNGIVEVGEECDDDNLANGDTCSFPTCEVLDGCGDGNIDAGEECDDNNVVSNDNCSATCQVENGCGNGIVEAGEECDDDNLIDGDTCAFPTCLALDGCGDGNLDAGEQCDDDNVANGDGCSGTCTLESLFFSEYIEGSSNNKAVEIRNPLPTEINLTGCSIGRYSNGGTARLAIALTSTVPANDVLVVCNSSATLIIALGLCDVTNSALNHNGNDALDLICGTTTLDIFGQIGNDPGTEWGTGLTSSSDNTLRRICGFTGDRDGSDVFDPAAEYAGFAVDTFDGLGDPTCAPAP
jgi:cysteine-rich repeat protein